MKSFFAHVDYLDEPKILQGIFKRAEWLINSSLEFLYFTPANATSFKEHLLLPEGQVLQADEGFAPTNFPFSISIIKLSETIREFVVTLMERSRKVYEGFYYFVIETRSEDGTLMKRNYSFELQKPIDKDFVPTVFNSVSMEDRVQVPIGQTYEIVLMLSNLIIIRNASFEVFGRLSDHQLCAFRRLSWKAASECGVLAAIRLDLKPSTSYRL